MRKLIGLGLAVVAIFFVGREIIDDAIPPSNECNARQLGCKGLKAAKRQGIISGFEEYETQDGSIITWEIDDQDKEFLLIFKGKDDCYVQYDHLQSDVEEKALRLSSFLVPPAKAGGAAQSGPRGSSEIPGGARLMDGVKTPGITRCS